jgi:RHS repeat-associated protein
LTTQFSYDGYVPNHIKRANELLSIGNRVRTVVDGQATDYVMDVASPLPQALVATTGEQSSYCLHGADGSARLTTSLIAQYDSGTWAYHLPDALGSVRGLTDPTGQVVSSYSFSPFGVPADESGGDPYGYTGEWWESQTELLYLRARMYQPGVGRFVSSDPWPGDPLRPLSLNGWVYVTNDPINVADPTGLREWKRSSTRWERVAEKVYATSRPDIHFIHLEPMIPVPWGSFGRPDVLNSLTGDVYEVEPLHLLPVAFAEAIYYRDLLTWAGGGGYNFWGRRVTGHWALPRSDPNDWNLTTWQLGLPFPPIRKTPGLIHTAYGPEIIPPGFNFVVMSPGGGAMVWWFEPRPETIATACFALAGMIALANAAENIVTGGTGLVDEPVVIVFAGMLIVIGKSIQSANAPVIVN